MADMLYIEEILGNNPALFVVVAFALSAASRNSKAFD